MKIRAVAAVAVLGLMVHCEVTSGLIHAELGSSAEAQSCPPVTGDLDQKSADIKANKGDNSCTVPNGGYAKPNQSYKLHVRSQVGGWCQTYVLDHGSCVQSTLYTRKAVGSGLKINGAGNGSVFSTSNVTLYDTCGNGNCTPQSSTPAQTWSASALGTYIYTAANTAGGSQGVGCNFTATFPENTPQTINVVSCAPAFKNDQYGNIVHWAPGPNPSTPITNYVYVPATLQGTGLDTALTAAISSWNTAMNAALIPVQFARTTSSCAGSHCINLTSGATDNGGNDCADIHLATNMSSGGEVTDLGDLIVRSDWNSGPGWDGTFLERTMAHELGHGLGLLENLCTAGNSLMGQFTTACGSVMTTKSPTTTDKIPVSNTTYGGGTRLSCGF